MDRRTSRIYLVTALGGAGLALWHLSTRPPEAVTVSGNPTETKSGCLSVSEVDRIRKTAKTDFARAIADVWEIEEVDERRIFIGELGEIATTAQWMDLARAVDRNGTNDDSDFLNSVSKLGVSESVELLGELEKNSQLILILQKNAAQKIVMLAPTPEAALLETNKIDDDSVGFPVAGEVIRMLAPKHPLAALSFAAANPEVIEYHPRNLSNLLGRAAAKHPEEALGVLIEFRSSENVSGYVRDFSRALSAHREDVIVSLISSIEDEGLRNRVRDEVARNLRSRGRGDVASTLLS